MATAVGHAVLRCLGADGGQGRLFGRPALADVLVEAGTVLTPESLTARVRRDEHTTRAPSIGSRGPSVCVRGRTASRQLARSASSVG